MFHNICKSKLVLEKRNMKNEKQNKSKNACKIIVS